MFYVITILDLLIISPFLLLACFIKHRLLNSLRSGYDFDYIAGFPDTIEMKI